MSRCQIRNPLTGQKCVYDIDAYGCKNHKEHQTEDCLVWRDKK